MQEEIIDVLDELGNPTGKSATKTAIHERGLWHRTAHVWIITPDGRLILQRRGPDKDTHPNCWDISSAGHASAGETSRQAAVREVQEELGLDISEQDLEYLFTVHGEGIHQEGKYINREYQDVYLITRHVRLADLKSSGQ